MQTIHPSLPPICPLANPSSSGHLGIKAPILYLAQSLLSGPFATTHVGVGSAELTILHCDHVLREPRDWIKKENLEKEAEK